MKPKMKTKEAEVSQPKPQEASSTSTSETSSSAPVSSGILPLPQRKRGRPPGSKTKKELSDALEASGDAVSTKRKLPEDPEAANKALAIYKMMASPVVGAVSSSFKLLGTEELNAKEVAGGEFAIGALLFQYGAELDAKLLCLLWAASISAPRLAQLAMDKKAKKETVNPIPDGAEVINHDDLAKKAA